jgi:polysaccharide pyruvyl transferase WcaK-like protein
LKKICVLGNFSGRNAGDAAILGSLMNDISETYTDVEFLVPTINPGFVKKNFVGYNVKVISLLPWNLSLKIFGLPTLRAVLGSNLVLITDNILFDRKLFNPLFNYLSTISLVVPLARKKGIPTVLYNASLGPINTTLGRYCLNRIIKNSDLVILRDTESERILKELEIKHRDILIAADCALNIEPSNSTRVEEIIKKEWLFMNPTGTLGFNVNSYIDVYVRSNSHGISIENFVGIISRTVDRAIEELGVDVLFIITQIMDLKIAREVMSRVANKHRIKLISNENYSYRDLAGIMSRLEVLIGMRTHSLILAASVGTPVAGIISYPKTTGFLKSIRQEKWMIEFANFNVDNLYLLVKSIWENRGIIRQELKSVIKVEKEKAKKSAKELARFLS